MKRFVVFMLVVFMSSPTLYANEVFRNLSWTDPPSVIGPSFSTVSEYDALGVEVYCKEREDLTLGSVLLNKIEYHYFQNQLFKIVVFVKNEDDNRDAAKAMVEARYGKPTRKALLANESTWDVGDTTIVWHWPFPGTPDPRIIFSSNRLSKELADYQKAEKGKQAAEDAKAW